MLARIYQQAPGVISIGSNAKAEKHFKAALALFPKNAGNQILYADFLKQTGNPDLARDFARKGLAELGSGEPYERRRWQEIGDAVLKQGS